MQPLQPNKTTPGCGSPRRPSQLAAGSPPRSVLCCAVLVAGGSTGSALDRAAWEGGASPPRFLGHLANNAPRSHARTCAIGLVLIFSLHV